MRRNKMRSNEQVQYIKEENEHTMTNDDLPETRSASPISPMQRAVSGESAISELTNPDSSHRLLSIGDEESLYLESSTACEESEIQISILQPRKSDTSPKRQFFSEGQHVKQHNEKSKVPPPFLMRHTATSTTSFTSSPGAMAVRGIRELPHTPSTIACDDDDEAMEADCTIEVEGMATAIAISDKELEDEYRLRILKTAVQAKVVKAEYSVSHNPCSRMNKMIIGGLLLAAAVVLTVVLWPRSREESSTSFAGVSPSYPTVAPTTPFYGQVLEYFRKSEAYDPLQHEIGTDGAVRKYTRQ